MEGWTRQRYHKGWKLQAAPPVTFQLPRSWRKQPLSLSGRFAVWAAEARSHGLQCVLPNRFPMALSPICCPTTQRGSSSHRTAQPSPAMAGCVCFPKPFCCGPLPVQAVQLLCNSPLPSGPLWPYRLSNHSV